VVFPVSFYQRDFYICAALKKPKKSIVMAKKLPGLGEIS
jgi:hypothetical protein